MSKEQKNKLILSWIQTLATSQGMYGRLLNALNQVDEDERDVWLSQYHDCNTMLDFVMKYEC